MIPVFDLKGNYKSCQKEILKAIQLVLESGSYILGQEVAEFEKEFAKATDNKYCVGVGSGTDALTLSLMALGVGMGDQVITTNFTAFPTIVGIQRAHAVPVVIDVKENALMDERLIEKVITKHTKAILPVHLFNRYCDMKKINRIAQKHKLLVIEDCAQRTFTKITGNIGAFSFYPTKKLGCYGDGGAVCTNDKSLYNKLLAMRNYGQTEKNIFTYEGLNSRLDEIQAAILRVKLKKRCFLKQPHYERSFKRDYWIKTYRNFGIESIIHYPYTASSQNAFKGKDTHTIQADLIASEIMTLPKIVDSF